MKSTRSWYGDAEVSKRQKSRKNIWSTRKTIIYDESLNSPLARWIFWKIRDSPEYFPIYVRCHKFLAFLNIKLSKEERKVRLLISRILYTEGKIYYEGIIIL